jgi:6-phosphogluconolactonase/glucosamine-6-phosphate isomerase/deaminase
VCDALSGQQRYIKTLDPGEAVPGEICIDCMAKQDLIDQAVKDGGVRFQCIGCGKDGVFSSATPFAQRVREETKKPAPHDVFVQIKVCPQCSPVPETEPELEDHQAVGEMEDAIMSASTNLAQEVEDES